jgi:hypothetical protein
MVSHNSCCLPAHFSLEGRVRLTWLFKPRSNLLAQRIPFKKCNMEESFMLLFTYFSFSTFIILLLVF